MEKSGNTLSTRLLDTDSEAPPFTILFSSPTRPTDLLMKFDMNGCVVSANEVGKVGA